MILDARIANRTPGAEIDCESSELIGQFLINAAGNGMAFVRLLGTTGEFAATLRLGYFSYCLATLT
jgi:hypothetical protein